MPVERRQRGFSVTDEPGVEVDSAAATRPGGVALAQSEPTAARPRESAGRSPFRTALSKRQSGRASDARDHVGEAPRPQMGNADTPSRGERRSVSSAQVVTPAVGRVLLAATTDTKEARIRIEGGLLSGVELQLRAHGPGVVTAQLLAVNGEARATLRQVMDEILLRLRRKGISLSLALDPKPPHTPGGSRSR